MTDGFKPCDFERLTGAAAREFLISLGENPDWPKRGVSRHQHAVPVTGMRNHVCEVDGHSDPDNVGLCIYCSCITDPDDSESKKGNK